MISFIRMNNRAKCKYRLELCSLKSFIMNDPLTQFAHKMSMCLLSTDILISRTVLFSYTQSHMFHSIYLRHIHVIFHLYESASEYVIVYLFFFVIKYILLRNHVVKFVNFVLF